MARGAGLVKELAPQTLLFVPSVSFESLLGAASEETQDDSGGNPIVVLMSVRAERRSVVVDIEQADFPATGRVEIDSASHFKRNGVLRSSVTAAAADSGVGARAADEGFREGSQVPAISRTVVVARTIVISVENILGATDGYQAVAGVADDLQPGFEVPSKGAESTVEVG